MSGTPADISRARLDADRARADLSRTVARIRHRLSPRTIAQDTWEDVRSRTEAAADTAVEVARRRPAATAGIFAGAALFLFRRPLLRFVRSRGRHEEPEGGDVRFTPETNERPGPART